ncbi:MAG: pyridoxamine 5'-phosphate oxidase [Rhodospirillaceae bacterium]|nr:pyridoxamine 5'-phosphate oxidase [Rhodospirillaceae bacterium]
MIKKNNDPLSLFHEWLEEAKSHEPNDPTAACLATADQKAVPSARMILLKSFGSKGFVFYTNMESRKGDELASNPSAALCFHWKSIRRQVRVEGVTEEISSDIADAYFRTRARSSQIGAWASAQSQTLPNRAALEGYFAEYEEKFRSEAIPRPPHWSGYTLKPRRIEFWLSRESRLHERLSYSQEKGVWRQDWLFP